MTYTLDSLLCKVFLKICVSHFLFHPDIMRMTDMVQVKIRINAETMVLLSFVQAEGVDMGKTIS